MAHPPAPALVIRDGDFDVLVRWSRSSAMRAGLVQRARIILMAAEGAPNSRIAREVGVSVPTVLAWRGRYQDRGMAGLEDEQRAGRPREIDRTKIIAATLTPPPAPLGITHWSSRLLARHLKTDFSTVAKTWREYGVKPWKSETFKFSTDPELEAKVVDVVGPYLAPPENAVVLCIDEKSQIQALDRTAPLLPMQIGSAEKRTHDYVRHGTTTLFAALDIATGNLTGLCKPAHTHKEFLSFLKHVARAYSGVELHLVMDNYATHKKAEVRTWLAENPRIHVHFTPTSGSWLNMVEIWFGIIERQAIHRGTFTSVTDLMRKIRQFITGWNKRSHPFTWTKSPEESSRKPSQRQLQTRRTSDVAPREDQNHVVEAVGVECLGEARNFECGRLLQLFPYGAAGGGNAVGVFDIDRVRR